MQIDPLDFLGAFAFSRDGYAYQLCTRSAAYPKRKKAESRIERGNPFPAA
jgi:hypothetical protein